MPTEHLDAAAVESPFAAALNVMYAARPSFGRRVRDAVRAQFTKPAPHVAPAPEEDVRINPFGSGKHAHPPLAGTDETFRGSPYTSYHDGGLHDIPDDVTVPDSVGMPVPTHVERLLRRALTEAGYSRAEIDGSGRRSESMLVEHGHRFAAIATPLLKEAADSLAPPSEVSDILHHCIHRMQLGGHMGALLPPADDATHLRKSDYEEIVDLKQVEPPDTSFDFNDAYKATPEYKAMIGGERRVDGHKKRVVTRGANDAKKQQTLHDTLLSEVGVTSDQWEDMLSRVNARTGGAVAKQVVGKYKTRLLELKGEGNPAATSLHKQYFSKGAARKLQRRRYAAEAEPTPPVAVPKRSRATFNPNAAITKKALYHRKIVAPLRGTRLAYHLLDIVRKYGKDHPEDNPEHAEIYHRALFALQGREFPDGTDHFAALGQMLKEQGDSRATAFNWHRVKESLAVDTAVRKWLDIQATGLKGTDAASKVALRRLVNAPALLKDGQTVKGEATKQRAMIAHLRSFVRVETGQSMPGLDVSGERLKRSITRLAGADSDLAELGSHPRAKSSVVTKEVGKNKDGSDRSYDLQTDSHSWRDYMSWLPGNTSAEKYQRMLDVVRYASYKAPAGGMAVGGLVYPGGSIIPDPVKAASRNQPKGAAPLGGSPTPLSPMTKRQLLDRIRRK